MKKICTLLMAAGLVFGAATGASAIDFKAKGQWIVEFNYGQNGNFYRNHGYANNGGQGNDDFDAAQRVRLQLDAVASENLSGTVYFEIGNQTWGHAGSGGALGADGNNVVKVKNAYLDWIVPQTDLKVRMGIQRIGLPGAANVTQILDADVAGVTASYQFNENVGLTAFWARPFNDNDGYRTGRQTRPVGEKVYPGLMDNVDLFALSLPLTFDGVKVTPFAMMAFMGPGALGLGKDFNDRGEGHYFMGGMLPLAGARHRNGALSTKRVSNYGTAWWAGVAADITVLDPIRIAADLNYGSSSWGGDARLNRAGWFVDLLAEYKMDMMTPGIYGWYASGDDSNPANGSERMPTVDSNEANNAFSDFAFSGSPSIYSQREKIVGRDMMGTWGIGLRLKDISFIEDLKHTLHVNYIAGTNSPNMLKKANNSSFYNEVIGAFVGTERVFNTNTWGTAIGANNMYLTTQDAVVEVGIRNDYKIYENLTATLGANYLFTSLGKNSMQRPAFDGSRRSIKDPWNTYLQFNYSF